MKNTYATSIVIALAALAGGQAMAASDYARSSSVTREQVRAEAIASREAHKNDFIDTLTGVNLTTLRASMHAPSSVTREQVKADAIASREAHKNDFIDTLTGVNLTTLHASMHAPSSVTREQVKAEAIAFREAHKNDFIDTLTGVNLTEWTKLRAANGG